MKKSKITPAKFEALDKQKPILEKKFGKPVFIDIKKEKLYIIDDRGNVEYVF